uniref:CUB domain-containing protein n=1 Tax=Anisakis simplex TaxID=6269 RepID=A0A0M3J3U4_ANISI
LLILKEIFVRKKDYFQEERSLLIPPFTTDSQPLEIQHDCTYNIVMHSRPYPYGDSEYSPTFTYTVPNCVDGYCSCRSWFSFILKRISAGLSVSFVQTYKKSEPNKCQSNGK